VSNAYFVPNLTNNLLSIGQLQEKRLVILIKEGTCRIYHQQRGLIINTQMTANRMFLVYAKMKPLPGNCLKMEEEDLEILWNRRYGHLNNKSIQIMQQKQMVKGLPKFKGAADNVCKICNVGKQQRQEFPKKSKWRASNKLELIHGDLCGPITPISHSGKRYLLVLVDDFSRKTWIYFLADKSETFETFKIFKRFAEKEAKTAICGFRTDRGGEFTSNEFNKFCQDNGIRRQLTAAYTPQQNGVAKRRNRTIMNMVRCLLSEKEMPKSLWPEVARWTAHVLNRSYTKAVKDMVPEERWTGVKPDVEYFRVFGSIAHVHVPEQKRTKLDNRSHKCILLGVSDESKAYRLYDLVTKKIIISRDVIFEEGGKWEWNLSTTESEQNELTWGDDDDDITIEESEGEETDGEFNEAEDSNLEVIPEIGESSNSGIPQQTRRRREPVWMRDYESGNRFPEEEESDESLAFHISNDDPIHFDEAVKEKKWQEAMKLEIEAIERNQTWEFVSLPHQARKIGVKWVFKTKFNEEGKVDKCKARLVAKGYSQKAGIDYNEVYAPIARWDTIIILLALAAQRGWCIFQLDVKSVFLYGELKEEVYVDQPEGFVIRGQENKVYRLKKLSTV
jgi:transposase InsO family protein